MLRSRPAFFLFFFIDSCRCISIYRSNELANFGINERIKQKYPIVLILCDKFFFAFIWFFIIGLTFEKILVDRRGNVG